MIENISLRRHSLFDPNRFFGSLLVGVVGGMAAGLVAGIAARLAMRVIALLGNQTPGFSIQGSLFIVVLGALMGMWLGILYGFLYPFLPGSAARKAFFFGLLPAVIFAGLLLLAEPEGELALGPRWLVAALFASLPLLYGVVLGQVAARLVRGGREFNLESRSFASAAGLLALIFALGGAIVQIVLAAAHPAAINFGFATGKTLSQFAGVCVILAAFIAIAGLMRCGAAGKSALGMLGLGAGLVIFSLLGLVSVFAGPEAVQLHGLVRLMDGRSSSLSDFYLLIPLLLGDLGLLAAGSAVLRAGRWSGWRAYTLLAAGLLPFLGVLLLHPFLLPALVKPLALNRIQTSYWLGALFSLCWLAVGAALRVETSPRASSVEQTFEASAAEA